MYQLLEHISAFAEILPRAPSTSFATGIKIQLSRRGHGCLKETETNQVISNKRLLPGFMQLPLILPISGKCKVTVENIALDCDAQSIVYTNDL